MSTFSTVAILLTVFAYGCGGGLVALAATSTATTTDDSSPLSVFNALNEKLNAFFATKVGKAVAWVFNFLIDILRGIFYWIVGLFERVV